MVNPQRPQPLFLEDLSVGDVFESESLTLSAEQIVAFAEQFDPQPFHLDDEAAKGSFFQGLAASGWHTVALLMRLYVDNFLSPVSALVSPGVDELRWRLPVRPGDALTAQVTILETKRSRSQPMQGALRVRVEGFNQDGLLVASFIGATFVKCRAPA